MKSMICLAALCGALGVATAGTASAGGAFSYPAGQVVYSYSTPSANVYGAIQVGGTPTTSVSQSSAANLAVIGQVGNKPSSTVIQSGKLNAATVSQTSTVNASALNIQFGSID